ncbi:MAG: 30S ribosomal protein S20 [Bacilli bacterium]|nr:30S ribosomal protein S20 [Bacilli bacterium]
MPNIQGAIKRVRGNGRKKVVNTYVSSSMSTAIKKFERSVKENDKKTAAVNLNVALQRIDKAVNSNLVHKNKAARLKSRLTKKYNNMK